MRAWYERAKRARTRHERNEWSACPKDHEMLMSTPLKFDRTRKCDNNGMCQKGKGCSWSDRSRVKIKTLDRSLPTHPIPLMVQPARTSHARSWSAGAPAVQANDPYSSILRIYLFTYSLSLP